MTSKERVLTALASQEPDRVPINYSANNGIDQRLKQHFGLARDADEGLLQALGVDFRGVGADYIGPKLHKDIPERGVTVDNWGIHRRWVEHETGGYDDYCDFPLSNADEETIANWPMPDPDQHDYSHVYAHCKSMENYAVTFSCFGDLINGNGMLRGMEQTLVDLITDEPAGLLLADRRFAIQIELTRRTSHHAQGYPSAPADSRYKSSLPGAHLRQPKAALTSSGSEKTLAHSRPPSSAWTYSRNISAHATRNWSISGKRLAPRS